MRLIALLLHLILVTVLGGCAQSQSAAWETARHFAGTSKAIDEVPAATPHRYLRVTTQGQVALLVLGDLDRDNTSKPIEVWYSAGHEVLRLQDGRLVGLVGTPIEWLAVQLPANIPAWSQIAAPFSYERVRDEMPRYRIAVRESVRLEQTPPVRDSALRGVDPAALQWFEETAEAASASSPSFTQSPHTLRARYAIARLPSGSRPTYGEQCLTDDLCITWQAWPPQRSEH